MAAKRLVVIDETLLSKLNLLDYKNRNTLSYVELPEGLVNSALFLDEDTMASNSAIKGATQQSIKAYADSKVGDDYIDAEVEDIAAATGGAISVATFLTTLDTDAGGDAFTLADGTFDGQLKKIQLIVDGGGDAVITTATAMASGTENTITMADAGDFVLLRWNGSAWRVVDKGNTVDGVTAPVMSTV